MAFWFDPLARRPRSDLAAPEAVRDLNAVWDAIGDWMLRVRHDGVLLASNQPVGTPFPVVTAEDLGQPASRLFPESAAHVFIELVPRTLQNRKPSTFEYAFGDGYYAEVRMFPVGQREVVVIGRDLTGRKSTEDTLRRGRERYALAIQGANDGLWDWQLDSNYVYYSLQWKALLGLDREGVPPSPEAWFSRIHPDDRDRVRAELDRHLVGDTVRFETEHRILDREGTWLWVLVRGMALRDARGEPTRIAGSLTDLTHRRVVAAAEEKGRLLEHATRAVGIGIGILLPDGGMTQVSPTLAEMVTAWDGHDRWWERVTAAVALPRGIRCSRCPRRQRVGSILAELATPDGEPRLFEITLAGHAHEVFERGDAHVVLVEDVTEAKLAERRLQEMNLELVSARDQALASVRAKTTFLANMSHELRTPLNAIIGYSDLLIEELEEAEVEVGQHELERIRTAGGQLLELISGVLDLSKVEAGMMALEPEMFEVGALIDEITPLVEREIRGAGNAFDVQVAADCGDLHTDRGKLRRILMSLLGNANKFTEDGAIRLDVAPDGEEHLRFTVTDTGIGIGAETQARLFEEFYQGDLSSTKRYGGAGLGLALCRRFVALMGGEIDLLSAPGKGSTFTVRIPRVVAKASA